MVAVGVFPQTGDVDPAAAVRQRRQPLLDPQQHFHRPVIVAALHLVEGDPDLQHPPV